MLCHLPNLIFTRKIHNLHVQCRRGCSLSKLPEFLQHSVLQLEGLMKKNELLSHLTNASGAHSSSQADITVGELYNKFLHNNEACSGTALD